MAHTFHPALSVKPKSSSDMLSSFLVAFCLSVASVRGECMDVADDRPEGCFDEPNIAQIVCFETDPCVCKDGDSGEENSCTEIVPADVLLEVTAAEMNGDKYRAICEVSKQSDGNSSKCEYFRWEKVYLLIRFTIIMLFSRRTRMSVTPPHCTAP